MGTFARGTGASVIGTDASTDTAAGPGCDELESDLVPACALAPLGLAASAQRHLAGALSRAPCLSVITSHEIAGRAAGTA
jgi:hypothetical protein